MTVIHVNPPATYPGQYGSWADWRGQPGTLEAWAKQRVDANRPMCPTCWGQGRIWTPVRRPRGQLIGHVPDLCNDCDGTGRRR